MSCIFNSMHSPVSPIKINKETVKKVEDNNIKSNETIKMPDDSLTLTEKAETKLLSDNTVSNIKKSVRDGAVYASLAYTGSAMINYAKEKIAARNTPAGQPVTYAKVPGKYLAIGVGIVSVAASLWTQNTTDKLSELAQKLRISTNKWKLNGFY